MRWIHCHSHAHSSGCPDGIKSARNVDVKSEAERSCLACLAVGAGALVGVASVRHGVCEL